MTQGKASGRSSGKANAGKVLPPPTARSVAAALLNAVLGEGQMLSQAASDVALMTGLTEALLKGHWQPHEVSDERRRALLPRSPAPAWDDLMLQRDYMHALDWVP